MSGFEDKIEYHYQRNGELVHKQVAFFLARTNTSDVKLSHEHLNFTWLRFNDAMQKLTYKTAQNLLKRVKDSGFES